jgi:hypothetical protein
MRSGRRLSKSYVLPDGLTTREVATSWRVPVWVIRFSLGPAVGRALFFAAEDLCG